MTSVYTSGYWVAKKFAIDRIATITNIATRAPGGVHEDEVPEKLANGTPTANKVAIVYQVEVAQSALGQGATYVWDEIFLEVDVQVPGTSQGAGRTLMQDVFKAFHTATGSNVYGTVSSCVFRRVIPVSPEHIEATGEDYEHLRQRFELHARGTG